jgi:hypothetical protein
VKLGWILNETKPIVKVGVCWEEKERNEMKVGESFLLLILLTFSFIHPNLPIHSGWMSLSVVGRLQKGWVRI